MRECRNRNLIRQTEAGPRVLLRDLWQTFNRAEWNRWNRESIAYRMDEHGLDVEQVEAFLEAGVRQQKLWEEL